jgi:hypothetical protein
MAVILAGFFALTGPEVLLLTVVMILVMWGLCKKVGR